MGATSIRLPDDLRRALDRLAEQERSDRSDVMRRALERGVKSLAMDSAVEAYRSGRISAWRAARLAGVSLWGLLDELKRRDLWFRTDEEAIREQLEALG